MVATLYCLLSISTVSYQWPNWLISQTQLYMSNLKRTFVTTHTTHPLNGHSNRLVLQALILHKNWSPFLSFPLLLSFSLSHSLKEIVMRSCQLIQVNKSMAPRLEALTRSTVSLTLPLCFWSISFTRSLYLSIFPFHSPDWVRGCTGT